MAADILTQAELDHIMNSSCIWMVADDYADINEPHPDGVQLVSMPVQVAPKTSTQGFLTVLFTDLKSIFTHV